MITNQIVLLTALLGLLLAGCGKDQTAAPPLALTLASGDVEYPTAGVDAETGTAYFAWIARAEGEANVYLSRLYPGSTALSLPVRVNHLPGDANAHGQAPAQVATGPDGLVYVAWTNRIDVEGRRFPASDLRFARSTDGGRTFAPTISVNDDAEELPSGHTFHDLTVGPDGTVYVSWLDSRARDRAQAALASQHTPPVHSAAHVHAAGDDLPGTELRVARSTDHGQTFGPSVVVARGTCQCCRTALAADASGAVYVAWRHLFAGGARDMALARSTDGGRTFSEPTRLHADGWQIDACPHSGPGLAVDGHGTLHVSWYTGVEGGTGLYYATSDDGGATFAPPTALAPGVPVAQARLTRDAEGNIWMAWEDPLQQQVRLAVASTGQAPRVTRTLAGSAPAVAAGPGIRVAARQEGHRLQAHVERF